LSKQCKICNLTKKLGEFYAHPASKDGHLNKCKECHKAAVKVNYRSNKEYYQEYERKRFRCKERKKKIAEYQRKRRAKNPEKYKARMMLNNSIRDGKSQKKPCEFCGCKAVEAHHHDYSKPLDVKWLCFICHRREHNQMV
jgi:hypothetical protein